MSTSIVQLLISLISGAVGGNLAGAAMKDKSLGPLGNSLAGIFGGGLGGAILQLFGLINQTGTLDISSIIANIASGGVGGGILMMVIAAIKKAMAKTG